MDNPVTVRRDQCVGELDTRIEDFVRREAGPSQLVPPCAAFNELINNKAPLTLLDKVIHGGDTWMAQGGSCAGFGSEPTAQLGVVSSIGRQNLQGNYTIQAGVIGAQNHPHTTTANFSLHLVPALYELIQHG
jgi:hypothetical protein